MAKSKRVSVSKSQLVETGEELEVAGVVVAVEGAAAMVEGVEDLAVARAATAVGVAEVAAGARDLTRAEDAAIAAERMQDLSDIVGAVSYTHLDVYKRQIWDRPARRSGTRNR